MTEALALFFDEPAPEPVVVVPAAPVLVATPPDLVYDRERIQRGLCQCYGDPATQPLGGGRKPVRDVASGEIVRDPETNEPTYVPAPCPPGMRKKYPALFCQQCWEEGRWREGFIKDGWRFGGTR